MPQSIAVSGTAYLEFDGIEGESKDRNHKNWIEIQPLSTAETERDAGSGLATGKRAHKPLTVTKAIDKATPLLLKTFNEGTALSNLTVSRMVT